MFQWVFSILFPRLLPKHVLQNIKIVITDGDPQEFTHIDNAKQNIIPNTKKVRYEWHIITQGFERHVDTTFPDIAASVVEKHKKRIQSWMYSDTMGNIETPLLRVPIAV